MKEILRFLSSSQFQSFTSQLLSSDSPTYQSIEGASGDGGIDGIDGDIVYQMYFPEEKNRTDKNYIKKINNDLEVLLKTIEQDNLEVTRWVLVVPEDLTKSVMVHLKKKSKEVGFECVFWGANRLSSIVHKHPHIKNAFPEIFLPDVKEDLGEVKSAVSGLGQQRVTDNGVEILNEIEFNLQKSEIERQTNKERELVFAQIGPSSALDLALVKVDIRKDEKLKPLLERKKASDRYYEILLEEMEDNYKAEMEKAYNEYTARGLSKSGMEIKRIAEIKKKRQTDREKLALKYGKPFEIPSNILTED